MKKIYAVLAALICACALNAKTIYLNTGGSDLWEKDGANHFAVWHWQGDGNGEWTGWMTLVEGNVWQVEISDSSDKVIFCRFNNTAAAPSWGDDMWNQTNDLTPGTNNLFTITGWGNQKSEGTWSVYGSNPGGGDNPGGGSVEGNPRYYYKGWVDGADVEPSEATIFDHGVAEIEFATQAALFVLYQVDGFPGVQYMTSAWVDGPRHATLSATGGYEKWNCPLGTTTLYLYDNEDGTLEISADVIPGKKLADPQPDTQDVEKTEVAEKTRKVMENGQLIIIRGEKRFDATGRQL
jgi:hypothetical protein